MKKFKFKLEPILMEYKRIEDLRLKDWVLSKRILQCFINDLHGLEKKIDQTLTYFDNFNSNYNASHNIGWFHTLDNFISGTKIRIGWKKNEIERGTKLTEKKKSEYIKAAQKRKTLEKLKGNELEVYKRDVHKNELKLLDDLYIMNGSAQRRLAEEDINK